MYHLNEFCNIIAFLRKEKSMTQTALAEKLGISPQSVSKWECGIGYPDVTLFPVIAELFKVPIGVLFGEKAAEDADRNPIGKEFNAYADICHKITVCLGNICRVVFIEDHSSKCRINAVGDSVFLRYFNIEQSDDSLTINIKNPSGSSVYWKEYDRSYDGQNVVQISIGCAIENVDIITINYLDLNVNSRVNEQRCYEVVCEKPALS